MNHPSAITLLTRPAVAKELGLSLRTVDQLIANGDLPIVKIGKSVRIRPASLENLIEARETRSGSKPRK